MHALDLAELATIVARYSPTMIAHRSAPPRSCQQRYWLEAKFRHDFWSSKLATHRQEIQCLGVTHRRHCWQRILPIMEDILVAEPLTRCIAYHARLLADRSIDSDFSTLANSVLSSHIEARHRCLHLLVFGEGLSVEHSVRLNRIRRELESFSDSLLGTLQPLECQPLESKRPEKYAAILAAIYRTTVNAAYTDPQGVLLPQADSRFSGRM